MIAAFVTNLVFFIFLLLSFVLGEDGYELTGIPKGIIAFTYRTVNVF